MFLPRTLVHRARPPLLRQLLDKPQCLTIRPLPLLSRHHRNLTTSTTTRPKSSTQPPTKKPNTSSLPPTIPLFTIPLLPFTTIYFTRLLSVLLFGAGTIFSPPYILLSPTAPAYLVPAFAIASAVPAALSAWMVGGFVTHVNLHLPPEARRSQDALRRWMERGGVKGDTRLEVRMMWFRPWLHRMEVEVGDLRKLKRAGWREGWLRLANLEMRGEEYQDGTGVRGLVGRLRRRLFVMKDVRARRKGKLDEGVWESVWDAIPMVDEEWDVGRNIEQKTNTYAKASSPRTERGPPPPPKPRP